MRVSRMRVLRSGAVALLVVGLAGCASGGDGAETVMPDVRGKTLDVAKSDIEHAGFTDDVDVDGGGLFGIVDESNWQVCEQSPAAGEVVTDPPRLTVDRSCDDGASAEESQESEPVETEPLVDADAYAGPHYEVIVVDEDVTAAKLKQYWVLTSELSTSTDAYKEQVKLLIADVARAEGTDKLIVQVVTEEEIVQAESSGTIADFMNGHDADYVRDVLAPKEAAGWVASYAGGFDYDTSEASDEAFVIDWWPAGDAPRAEAWRPQAVG